MSSVGNVMTLRPSSLLPVLAAFSGSVDSLVVSNCSSMKAVRGFLVLKSVILLRVVSGLSYVMLGHGIASRKKSSKDRSCCDGELDWGGEG